MPQTPPPALGEYLYRCYSNLAMAHAAVGDGSAKYATKHYMIRAKLFAGLRRGEMRLGPLADDDRVKLDYGKRCCYCGADGRLSLDHLLPRARGGLDSADNLVWACRSCNSSKGARDVLDWYRSRDAFPPLLLLRRYLKLAIDAAKESDLLDALLDDPRLVELPFAVEAIPVVFPPPAGLRLWAYDLET